LTWLSCRGGLAPRLKNLHQAAFGDRCDRSVVAGVASKLATLDHSLNGSAAHLQRLGGLIEVNEIVFGCSWQHVHHLLKELVVATYATLCRSDLPCFGGRSQCAYDTRHDRRVGAMGTLWEEIERLGSGQRARRSPEQLLA
jgi:hypothetical protein